ncbi:MAG: hypothetical protein K2Q06_09760 [Parvularculaceae bacterium]|nr:hypothetical protein [Parvularculaceae bacterium]
MTITVKVGDAKTRLSELISLAERGERIVIARGDTPVVELRLLDAAQADDPGAALAAMRRRRATRNTVSRAEVRRWIDQGRR